ncbi:hypothetical protein FACS1894214_0450 [Planctomycetales bacterium]|nr:hypothetical protein FACS1894214_0450 [Planctomycetales bacterium]
MIAASTVADNTEIEKTSENNIEKGFRSRQTGYLSCFPQGRDGVVVEMNTDPELQGRLMGMGLFIGTRFRLLQGGSSQRKPLLLAVGNTRIALGPEIAETILVEK